MNKLLDLLINKFLPGKIQKYFFKFPSFKQFVKFSFVGVVNTIIDFSIYFILTRFIAWFAVYYLVANAISFSVAVTNSFLLNKKWTFRDISKDKINVKYLKFILINVFSLIVVEFLFYYMVNKLDIFDLYAKIALLLYCVVSNFFLSKYWVFKDKIVE